MFRMESSPLSSTYDRITVSLRALPPSKTDLPLSGHFCFVCFILVYSKEEMDEALDVSHDPALGVDAGEAAAAAPIDMTARLESLLDTMNSVYVPKIRDATNWPQSIKKELADQTHKFMAVLTEMVYQPKGRTVLYIPQENIADVETSAADQDLVQRLETAVIYWIHQIKEVVFSQVR